MTPLINIKQSNNIIHLVFLAFSCNSNLLSSIRSLPALSTASITITNIFTKMGMLKMNVMKRPAESKYASFAKLSQCILAYSLSNSEASASPVNTIIMTHW